MELRNGFGERLRKLRKAKGQTAAQIAAKLGVSTAAVLKYEKDIIRPTVTNVQGLAAALETSVEYLVNGNGLSSKKDAIDTTYDMVRRIIQRESDLNDLQQLLLDFLASRIQVKIGKDTRRNA